MELRYPSPVAMPPTDATPPARSAVWLPDLAPPLLVALLLVMLWSQMFERAQHDDQLVIQEAFVNHGSIALAAANHAEQIFGRIRSYSGVLSDSGGNDAGTHSVVRKSVAADQALLRLMYFDAAGRLKFTSGAPPEAWLQAAARSFSRSPATPNQETLTIGEVPSDAFAQTWMLPVFHRPATSQGNTSGFTVALVDIGHFLRQYEGYALGRHGEVVLVAVNGHELLRVKSNRLDPVTSILGSERHRQAFIAGKGSIVEDTRDGHQRIFAYHRVPDSPVAALVSRTRYDVLLENKATQRGYWMSALMLTLIALLPMIAWLFAAGRRRGLLHRLAIANEENLQLVKRLETEKTAAYRLATHDKLTGLANRMLFAEIAGRYRARAQRTRSRFAILFIDLDRFKPINDTYGHKAGDQLLVNVAHRLLDCMRQADLVARLGGDEFVALLADLHNIKDVENAAAKVVSSLSQPFTGIVDEPLQVTPSIGIAIYPDDAGEIDDLVRYADAAMYRAKERGRATYVFADPAMNRKHDLCARIEAALPGALKKQEIYVNYQPIVSLRDFRITGIEALARWHQPSLGDISPAEFIPVAEQSGLIVELGEYVVGEVCAQLAAWRDAGIQPVPVAVNVSPLQLRSSHFAECIRSALRRYDLPASLLTLEIIETVVIEADSLVIAMLRQLDAMGIAIAIDDFGTGFSGLNHLRTLPVRFLKIDRSFIKDIRNDLNDATIVSSTISLSHNLKLITIAEGVETPDQLTHLRAAGCDEAQGFLFSPPCDASSIAIMLAAPNFFSRSTKEDNE